METIPHRELRNNSSAILARVANGESIAVTNHGEIAAILMPPGTPIIERLERAGSVRSARAERTDFTQLRRAMADSAQILADLRGDR
ncbi:MAG: type II toxin-antitoxin system Phd/YefM family antitoxin [Austwickia sp.]|nr:type II toxin-antitoxin system Phd/YefM family antitoxin [Austwickia sp.]MBK8437937.1 type II toxin-antitoxin system Phd/YefM family antitoxin [Austwickia sp.]MBK9100236.1 type II toxin-antitoxin system Phd/YefM family antitoxin [Austwickia sp.]